MRKIKQFCKWAKTNNQTSYKIILLVHEIESKIKRGEELTPSEVSQVYRLIKLFDVQM